MTEVEKVAEAIRPRVKKLALSGVEDSSHLDAQVEVIARIAVATLTAPQGGEKRRVEVSNKIADIVFDQVKRVWPDLHPLLDLRYGIADAILADSELVAALSRAAAPESGREDLSTEVTAKREMASPVYVLRGGVYLLDEHAGVLIDSAGNFSAKTRGNPRSLAVLLRAIAEAIEDDAETLSVGGENDGD